MDAAAILKILIELLTLAQAAGVNIQEISSAIAKAHAQGRDLTDAEIQKFAHQAQSAIDQARKA